MHVEVGKALAGLGFAARREAVTADGLFSLDLLVTLGGGKQVRKRQLSRTAKRAASFVVC